MSDLIKEASSAFSLGMKGGDAPVDKARKDMDPADPDFMAKRVPLIDVMKKLQHLETTFPKIKKLEVVVEKNSIVIAEVNQKIRNTVSMDQMREKFDQMNIQLKRQYQKDVEIYEEKTKQFLKTKLDIDEFNKRMRTKVNAHDFDVLNQRVLDLERLIKTTVQTLIEGQRREFKKALEQKASIDMVEEMISAKADQQHVENLTERVDHLETQVNHMRLAEDSDQDIDSDEELDDFDDALEVPESKPNLVAQAGSDPFMGGGGGALQKKQDPPKKEDEGAKEAAPEVKKPEEKKEEEVKAAPPPAPPKEEPKPEPPKEPVKEEVKEEPPKKETPPPPPPPKQAPKQEPKPDPKQAPKTETKPDAPAQEGKTQPLTEQAIQRLNAATDDIAQTKSKGEKSQVSSMRGGSKFMMKHIQNQLNLAQQKIQDLIEQKEALEKEINNVKEELGVVNRRSVENQDTVGVVKVLLEEIKQRDNDILDYTEYSKKQHAELLVVVNKNETIVKIAERELRRFIETTKKDNENRLRRIVVLEAQNNKLLKDFDSFKNYKRKKFEEITNQIFSIQDSKLRLERNFGEFLGRVTLLLNKQTEDKERITDEIRDIKVPMQEELDKMRKENESLLRELHRNQAMYREMYLDYQRMISEHQEALLSQDSARPEESFMAGPSTNTAHRMHRSIDSRGDSPRTNLNDISITSGGRPQNVMRMSRGSQKIKPFRTEKRNSASPSQSLKLGNTSVGFKDSTKMVALPPVSRGSTRMSNMRQLVSPESTTQQRPSFTAYVNVNPYGPNAQRGPVQPSSSIKNFISSLTNPRTPKQKQTRDNLSSITSGEGLAESIDVTIKGEQSPLPKNHKKILMQKMKK